MANVNINSLPAPTWTWLKVNEKQIAVPDSLVMADTDLLNLPDEVSVGAIDFGSICLGEVELGAGNEFKKVSDRSGVTVNSYSVASGVKVSETLRLGVDYDSQGDAEGFLGRTSIILGEGAELTAVITFKGKADFAANDIRIKAGKGAKLTLVEIFQLEEGSHFVDSIGGRYFEKGGLKLIQVESGSGDISLSCAAELDGYKSTLDIDTGYLVKGDDTLDINYVARHKGKRTDSKINVSGVLRDNASKVFRGTIDFIKGCKDATGDEREDVLLIDEGVKNSTVPLILCAEEDVEGAHGASIGKISDDVLLYFMSRGIPEDDVTELMAASRIDAVVGRIPDEETVKQLLGAEE